MAVCYLQKRDLKMDIHWWKDRLVIFIIGAFFIMVFQAVLIWTGIDDLDVLFTYTCYLMFSLAFVLNIVGAMSVLMTHRASPSSDSTVS